MLLKQTFNKKNMKTKKILIISSIVVLFITFNLSIALQNNLSEQKSGLISLFHSAYAAGEDCWFCPNSECGYIMTDALCPYPSTQYWKKCEPVCVTNSCDFGLQTFCE
jgi:hypothetical protein